MWYERSPYSLSLCNSRRPSLNCISILQAPFKVIFCAFRVSLEANLQCSSSCASLSLVSSHLRLCYGGWGWHLIFFSVSCYCLCIVYLLYFNGFWWRGVLWAIYMWSCDPVGFLWFPLCPSWPWSCDTPRSWRHSQLKKMIWESFKLIQSRRAWR